MSTAIWQNFQINFLSYFLSRHNVNLYCLSSRLQIFYHGQIGNIFLNIDIMSIIISKYNKYRLVGNVKFSRL